MSSLLFSGETSTLRVIRLRRKHHVFRDIQNPVHGVGINRISSSAGCFEGRSAGFDVPGDLWAFRSLYFTKLALCLIVLYVLLSVVFIGKRSAVEK